MGFVRENGQWADVEDISLPPIEGTLTIDGLSRVVELGDRATLNLVLAVSAVSASDTLDVTIEGSADKTNWYALGTFTQVSAPGTERKAFPADRYVRANFNVTGSGVSIACTLTGKAR